MSHLSAICQLVACNGKIMVHKALTLIAIMFSLTLAPAVMAQGNVNGNAGGGQGQGNGGSENANPNVGGAAAGNPREASATGQDNASANAGGNANANANAGVNNPGNGAGLENGHGNGAAGTGGAGGGNPSSPGDIPSVGSNTVASALSELGTIPISVLRAQSQHVAFEAVQSGRAVPLETIVASLNSRTEGQLIDASLIEVNGFLLYLVKVMSPSGRVNTQYFYARTGRPVIFR